MKDAIAVIGWPDGTIQVIIKGPNYDAKHCEDYIVIGEGETEKEALDAASLNLKIMSHDVFQKQLKPRKEDQ